MDIRYHSNSDVFVARGTCGRSLYRGYFTASSCFNYSEPHDEWLAPGTLPECVKCLTSICSELSKKPLEITREH